MTEISQTLDLWRGVITSTYKLDGVPVTVVTTCHPKLDLLAVEARSPLIKARRLAVRIAFPYGHPTRRDGADWKVTDRHSTDLVLNDRHAVFKRRLDNDRYEVFLGWDTEAALRKVTRHIYELRLVGDSESFSLACLFAPSSVDKPKVGFEQGPAAATAPYGTNIQTQRKSFGVKQFG